MNKIIFLILLSSAGAGAMTRTPIDPKELLRNSDLVAIGRISKIEDKEEKDRKLKYRVYTIGVIGFVKGQSNERDLSYSNLIEGGPSGTSFMFPDLKLHQIGIFFFKSLSLQTLSTFPSGSNIQ